MTGILLLTALAVAGTAASDLAPEARPWAYHWWPGSAVDETNLARRLREFRDGGFGGVHVVPIYGVRGAEARDVPYLSPRWLKLLAFTVRQARALGLGVDLTVGTGWCFGGPPVTEDLGGQAWEVRDGRLHTRPTRLRVKRAAPGGEGYMTNPYSPRSMRVWLDWWFERFQPPADARPRAVYHDSYEYFGCTWSPELRGFWIKRHGNDPLEELDALAGRGPVDRRAPVAAD